MNSRERFLATLSFGKPDRVFFFPGVPRRSTYAAWYLQGLPRMDETDEFGKGPDFDGFVGNDRLEGNLPVHCDLLPPFDEEVLELSEHGKVWRDTSGIVMHDAGDCLNTPGFKTRSYISHPVSGKSEWLSMRARFDPATASRYPEDWGSLVAAYRSRGFPVMVAIPGLYWKARDWVGFENLSTMFYDNPSLVHEMMEHNAYFIVEVLKRAITDGMVDCVTLNEDMAYKHAAMLSPRMFREFLLPRYKRIISELKGYGLPLFLVDSDGHIGELLPLWIEAGVDGCWPVEIAAHNDPVAYRKRYGAAISMWGGIDKREIRSKERVFREVMSRVPELLEDGGFLPMIDHAVPPDIPLRSYLYMCDIIQALLDRRDPPKPEDAPNHEDRLGPIQRMWSPDLIYNGDRDGY